MEIGEKKKKKKWRILNRLVFLDLFGLEEVYLARLVFLEVFWFGRTLDSGPCPESGGLDWSLVRALSGGIG